MMRFPFFAAVLLLAACGQQTEPDMNATACVQDTTHAVTWSNATAPDTVTAHAEGPTCVQASLTLVVRNAAGDALWSFASSYYDMTTGGPAPRNAPTVAPEQLEAFLTGWADVTIGQSSTLPAWAAGAATLAASATGLTYSTPFDRETYEQLRGQNLATLCYAVGVDVTQCLVIDPASQAPTLLVAYGP